MSEQSKNSNGANMANDLEALFACSTVPTIDLGSAPLEQALAGTMQQQAEMPQPVHEQPQKGKVVDLFGAVAEESKENDLNTLLALLANKMPIFEYGSISDEITMELPHSTLRRKETCMNYHHLTIEERSCIRKYYVDGLSYREIGKLIGRSTSTINREIRRNCMHMYDIPTYYPHTARKRTAL